MRKLILLISVIVVLTAGWIFYLNQEKKNFIENLPQSPATANQPINNSSYFVEEDGEKQDIPDARVHETLPQEQIGPAEKTSSEPSTPDEKADFVKSQWIQMFGDVPQVHGASEYMRKIYKQERMTIDEQIAGLEALHYLYPNGGHGILLAMRKAQKARGIDEGDFEIMYEKDFENVRYAPDHKVIHLGNVPEHLRSDASAPDSISSGSIDEDIEDIDFLPARSERAPVMPEAKPSVPSDHVHPEDGHGHEGITVKPPAPTAAKDVEAAGWEGLSSEQRAQAKQLFDEYGAEEGLRRLREFDPEAARRFERYPPQSPRKQGENRGRDVPEGSAPSD